MSDDPILSLPLDRLRRLLLQGKRPFVLGVSCFSTFRSGTQKSVVNSHQSAAWCNFVTRLCDQVESSWHLKITYHQTSSILASNQEGPSPRAPAKETTRTMQLFRQWRSVGSSVLDFGINDRNSLARFGRNCDGILLIVDAESFDAARWIKSLRRESLPWLGYWQVETQSEPEVCVQDSNVSSPRSSLTPQAA